MLPISKYINAQLVQITPLEDSIFNVYNGMLSELKPFKRQHFVTRAALCGLYTQEDVEREIKKCVVPMLNKYIKYFEENNLKGMLNNEILPSFAESNIVRKQNEGKYVRKHGKEYILLLCLSELFDVTCIVLRNAPQMLTEGAKKSIANIIKDNVEYMTNTLAEDKKNFAMHVPVLFTNAYWYLRTILKQYRELFGLTLKTFGRFMNLKDRLTTRYIDEYNELCTRGEYENIENVVYGLTHIVIGESNFYNCCATDDNVRLTLENFVHNVIYRNIAACSLDLLCECAVCLKLYGRANTLYPVLVKRSVDMDNANRERGILINAFPQAKFNSSTEFVDVLNVNEHTNILYLLLAKMPFLAHE